MPAIHESRRHPSAALCPHCDYPNQMPSECLRVEFTSTTCDLCKLSFEYRGVATGDAQNGEYEVEARRIAKEPIARPRGYALEDEATPPGGNVYRLKGNDAGFVIVDPWAGPIDDLTPPGGTPSPASVTSLRDIRDKLEAKAEDVGRSKGGPGIGLDGNLSDSHNCYRRRFEIEGDRVMLLGAATQAGSAAINKFWLDLGGALGFVWSTVRDLEVHEHPDRPDPHVVTFTAEVEGVIPASPAFENWWRDNRTSLPGARHEIAREAFEAGSRHAATVLSQLDGGVIEIVREVERDRPQDPFVHAGIIIGTAMGGGVFGAVLTALGFLFGSAL